jgi:hypothetical protein
MDLHIAEQQAREERTRSEALSLVRSWVDDAPAYEPTHPVRDVRRHEAIGGEHKSLFGPQVHELDIDGALDVLTKPRLRGSLSEEDWPAPFLDRWKARRKLG